MRESVFFNNIQVKLMLLFFVFALVPLFAVGIFSIKTAEEVILNMASNQIEHVATDKAALLERWISERKADVEVMAGSAILKSLDSGQIGPYLELIRINYKVYDEICVVSRDGGVVYDSSGKGLRSEEEEWFRRSSAGEVYMSDIGLTPERKDSFFRISAPLIGRTGGVEGVVCATVGTNTVLSDILRVSLGETGECYLVDRNGTFLAHKEPTRILSQNIAQSESFKNIFAGRKHRITYIDYRGIEVIGASAMVQGTDWALVVEQDRDEAFRSADRLKHYVYLAVVLSTCGALISAWLLSHYVVDPIRRLSKAAKYLARSEFEKVNIKTDRADEIGLLTRAFVEMAEQLQDRQSRLEEKVVLREAELKESDVKLKETQQAAARSQQLASLGRLAAGVAHEIRTPLTSLKLFLESVESEIEVSPEYEEDFQVAMKQIRRMESTINRFLDFARPQQPVLTAVDVGELVEDALLVVSPRARQQEIFVRKDVSSSLPEISGDKKQLGEALINLMVNGLEAMAERGELTITARMDEFSAGGGSRGCVRIEVSDTGPGIEQGSMLRLFDPFFTTKATGTGLGLSIVYATIQRHGGEVRVQSSPGGGATFSVLIPVSDERTVGRS